MIYVGLARMIVDGHMKLVVAKTREDKKFQTIISEISLKEELEELKKIREETKEEVTICFDSWGSPSQITEIIEFIMKNEGMHLELQKRAEKECQD